jgi:hypothetical protein
MAYEDYFKTVKMSSSSTTSPIDQEKRILELKKKEEEELALILAFAKALAVPKEAIRKYKDTYYLTGSFSSPYGTLNLNSKNASSHFPLVVKSLSPITKTQLIANLSSLLMSTPIPENLNRKTLSPLVLENSQFVLDLNKCLISTLRWSANLLKQQNKDMHWLPIIQDLLWQEWGWKKKIVPKKIEKKAQKKGVRPINEGDGGVNIEWPLVDRAPRNDDQINEVPDIIDEQVLLEARRRDILRQLEERRLRQRVRPVLSAWERALDNALNQQIAGEPGFSPDRF